MRIESKWSQGGKKLFAYVWKDRSAKTCANSIKMISKGYMLWKKDLIT